MSQHLRIVIAQQDSVVGDLEQNSAKIIQSVDEARDKIKADLVVFPELTLTGYPPEDLLLRKDFQQKTQTTLQALAKKIHGPDVILGYPEAQPEGLFNAAAVIREGQIIATYYKQHLPNYGVFDEKRYFTTGKSPCIFKCKDVPIAVTICEDLWFPDVILQAKEAGARIVCSLNASPYDYNKATLRARTIQERVLETGLPVIYAASIGGQDELIFDGGSMALDSQGQICQNGAFFKEELITVDVDVNTTNVKMNTANSLPTLSVEASIYQALILGLKDYVEKNKFPGVILGLSGGIDSALTLAIAVDALGSDRVQAVLLPSRFTSDLSKKTALEQLKLLNVKHLEFSIETTFSAYLETLKPILDENPQGVAVENIQARIRCAMLMAVSNQTHALLLATGNKSEIATGYTTLYGDMAGGFAVLKDVYKTMIYRLANYRNSLGLAIPKIAIERAPTAELAANQKDQDSLPPYAILDQILQLYVEYDKTLPEIIAAGFDPAIVKRTLKLVERNEYKRRQGSPGIKITPRAFGRDRRYPITSGFSSDE